MSLLLLLMLMMKQVLWGLTLRTTTTGSCLKVVSESKCFHFQRLLAGCRVSSSQSNDALLEQTLRFLNKQAQVFTTFKSYSRGAEKETVHKHYTAAGGA